MANRYANVSELVGQTLTSIEKQDDDELIFTLADGRKFRMYHHQDCCESVTIDDICGDLDDLIGSPLTMVEEASNQSDPGSWDNNDESYTWTFYRFATVKGYVTIRWYGSSNGFHSERVDFAEIS